MERKAASVADGIRYRAKLPRGLASTLRPCRSGLSGDESEATGVKATKRLKTRPLRKHPSAVECSDEDRFWCRFLFSYTSKNINPFRTIKERIPTTQAFHKVEVYQLRIKNEFTLINTGAKFFYLLAVHPHSSTETLITFNLF